uniref:Uncharacterized protein n=1 Tax=Arundo donax TaxID=35708 RepID=A0A0A9BV41_ARUDO
MEENRNSFVQKL